MISWIRENFHPLWHLRRKSAAFRWATRHIRVKVGVRIEHVDHKVYVDLLRNPHMVSSPNRYERADLDLMIDLVRRFNLRRMFDIGANLGIYSFTFSSAAPGGRVVAFEPDLVNAGLFDASNAACPRRNVALERKAVAEASGNAEFGVDDMSGATGSLNLGDSFTERNYGTTQRRTFVETTTVDQASRQFFAPDFIKIDVEGAELGVLKGAKDTLAAGRPIILVEINTEGALARVRALLEQFDYRLQPTSAPNYLAFHREMHVDA